MAIINSEEILKAVQAMSIDERLKLIAEIASLPETVGEVATEQASLPDSLSSQEVKEFSAQFIDKHRTLLHRLAQ